jgi:S-adenosylmethionine:tRNA ribosyltransferase-isomerase
LKPGDVLVMNDTRVTAVRLFGHKQTGGAVEVLLLRSIGDRAYRALLKPARRLREGTWVDFGRGLGATVRSSGDAGESELLFDPVENLQDRLRECGDVPLPPYITTRLSDPERYQTVFAQAGGSAAAPTAGLHFTKEVLTTLRDNQVAIATVTLHIGIDTFRPVQAEDLSAHEMHGEVASISPQAAQVINRCQNRIVAVGSTTVRTLETFATNPWQVRSGTERTRLFIRPGYRFQVVDGMLTNFHLPQTTMLMMISALAGREAVQKAYVAAIDSRYRFLSFGDSMLIL